MSNHWDYKISRTGSSTKKKWKREERGGGEEKWDSSPEPLEKSKEDLREDEVKHFSSLSDPLQASRHLWLHLIRIHSMKSELLEQYCKKMKNIKREKWMYV